MADALARWLLVRHGPTAWSSGEGNPAGGARYAGWSDVPLDAAGRRQASDLGRRLAPQALGTCYVSDLSRARQTLDLILARRRDRPLPPLHVDPDLRELHFGAWEGFSYGRIAATPEGPAVLAGERAAPGGEALADLAARVDRFLARLRQEAAPAPPDGTGQAGLHTGPGATLIVAHGGTLRVMLCLLLDLPPAAHWRFRLDHTSLSEVHWSALSGPRLVRLNDTGHVDGVDPVNEEAPEGNPP